MLIKRLICVSLLIVIAIVSANRMENTHDIVYAINEHYEMGHGWNFGTDYKEADKSYYLEIENYHRFRVTAQPSKQETIKSFDVSESGKLLLVMQDYMIWVIDEKGEFEYCISFVADGDYGALWADEKVVVHFTRTNYMCVLNDDGSIDKVYFFSNKEIKGSNYWNKVITPKSRTSDGCIYKLRAEVSKEYYTQSIIKEKDDGTVETIYVNKCNRPIKHLRDYSTFIISMVGLLAIWLIAVNRKNVRITLKQVKH